MGKQLSKCYFHWKDLFRCNANDASNKCIANVQYGYNPKPLYGAVSIGSTTINVSSRTSITNPKWIQYVTDPKNRTELEKQFGIYLAWNSAKYPAVSRAAENLLLERFSYAFPGYDDIGSFMTNELQDLRDAGRFELQPGKNANITMPPVDRMPNYSGDIRQVVFRCLGIQIDTNMNDLFDNSDGEKQECEAVKADDSKPWPPICDKK
ncbi:hypothetical protein Ddc_17376 [Ditylenchus destructor]|nr:hypothetical protein Ddc_17376 [Ditylenchus destructor]